MPKTFKIGAPIETIIFISQFWPHHAYGQLHHRYHTADSGSELSVYAQSRRQLDSGWQEQQLLPQLQLLQTSSSSEEEESTTTSLKLSDEVEYTSIVIQEVTPAVELPVETEYVTVASALSDNSQKEGQEEEEDLSLGESVVLGDGILNNLSCDLTENLNSVVALSSNRHLVNNSFVIESTNGADNELSTSISQEQNNEHTINIEMDTTASVI